MASTQDQMNMSKEDEDFLRMMHMPDGLVLSMVLKTAIELDLFELINKFGPKSSTEIASLLQAKNPKAPLMLDRILRFLASQSYLECTQTSDDDEHGHGKRLLYGLGPKCKIFIRNSDGVSFAPVVLTLVDKVFVNSWFHLKDVILEGGVPFDRTYGMNLFEYAKQDSRFNEMFNRGMYHHTIIIMKKMLEVYKGFEGVRKVIDVGGGIGASLACILSKYPNIKGINYDLPHVIKDAPDYPGVEHVEGDMFVSVPSGDVIFMKWILHNWSDDHCLKLLKNCWRALPDNGKVIVVEYVLAEYPETDFITGIGFTIDVVMMTTNPGGKERTLREFETLVTEAGFASVRLVCNAYNYWIMEVYKETRSSNNISL